MTKICFSAKPKFTPFSIELDDGTVVELRASKFTVGDQLFVANATDELNSSELKPLERIQKYNALLMHVGVRDENGEKYWSSPEEVVECDFPVELLVGVVNLIADINDLNVDNTEKTDLEAEKKSS